MKQTMAGLTRSPLFSTLAEAFPRLWSQLAVSMVNIPLWVFLFAGVTQAQVTSTIQGRITDPSGAVIAGSSIKVTNEATGVSRTGQSATDGYYRISDLLAGKYEVRVEQPGFKTLIRRGIELNSQTMLNLDLALEVGEITQTLEVAAEVPQIETTESRISEVLSTEQIRSLPTIGRGLLWLAMTAPGVQGKAEDGRGGQCCDSLSFLASPRLSSGGNELKAAFFVDGIAQHYGDARNWNLAFTPNLDAVEEVRVSTNPTSVDEGILSGVQVQMVTKGGTNTFHGTGHYTFLEDSFNALPYGANRQAVGQWHQRYFGGTIGGPIIRDRLFFFGAFEGLREMRPAAAGAAMIVETEAFKNWVVGTRPNSIAAQLLRSQPPFRYATDNLRDVNGDGIMDLGTVAMDRPSPRTGNQYNARVDYQTASGKDRFYGTFWRNQPNRSALDVRPTLDYAHDTGSNLISAVHSHTFTPNSLNELRFATWNLRWDLRFKEDRYNVPCVQTNDGLGLPSSFSGACSFSRALFETRPYDVRDTFSWNRGKQSWKFGASFRRQYLESPFNFIFGDTPVYNFRSVIDFANDNPFKETRAVDAATGKLRDTFLETWSQQLSFFAQNSWQVQPGLTLNLGLRWDYHYPHPIDGIQQPRNTHGLVYTSDQVTPSGILAFRNQKVERSFDPDLNNFGPRISIAWDPTRSGRTVIRGGFFVLYDELDPVNVVYRPYFGNPPASSVVSAGPQFGIPIVYAIAPEGTRDFPINPGLLGPSFDPEFGVYRGTRPNVTGLPTDFLQPLVYDANAAFQRQVLNDLAVTVSYHYRRITNELFAFNANRFSGDLVDGRLDRLSPFYGAITPRVNWGRRIYHGLVFEASKRLSQGWQLNASYNYHNGRTNFGGTEAFNPDLDWARDELATHNVKMNAVWELPFFRERTGGLATALGGWQLSTIWNFESGPYFSPGSVAIFGAGGDFNADGQTGDRPDLPATSVPRSYSHEEWMRGALSASIFPRPNTVRNGTLPRNYFRGPGYARIDASLAKRFPIHERATLQFRAEASNLLNQLNISGVSSSLTSTAFARASSFYPMRAVQLSVKVIF
ncbi:MAG: TonB-dependent receptor [Acidobacteria bacterium]|nr:TonB-dependent receptor [Acidobacteriota bacterium]